MSMRELEGATVVTGICAGDVESGAMAGCSSAVMWVMAIDSYFHSEEATLMTE